MAFSRLPSVVSLAQYTKAEHYDPTKDDLDACAHTVFALGGSRSFAIPIGGGAQDAIDYMEFQVPTSTELGFTYKVECEIKTEDAGTTVTPRLYNITDSAITWTGSAGTSTAWGTYQTSSALTIAAGKRYRLQATKSDDVVDGWVIGRIVRTA